MLIGLIGKANVGKSTFFVASTDVPVSTGNYPFTTVKPNVGICHVRIECVCKEFKVRDNPVHSLCIEGNRFIPLEIIDVAGLVPGAHAGRGLGNQFLDDARLADGLIHIVDISGSTDADGHSTEKASHDPLEDIEFVEQEFDHWLKDIVKKDMDKHSRDFDSNGTLAGQILAKRLSGLGIGSIVIEKARNDLSLVNRKLNSWTDEETLEFCKYVRKLSKPMVIAANKMDITSSFDFLKRAQKDREDVVPCMAEAEALLRKANKSGLVDYIPGNGSFKIKNRNMLNEKQLNALKRISDLMNTYGSTGVQKIINTLCFNLLKMKVVFPVEDDVKLTDKKGNILPEARLLDEKATARDLAYNIHNDLGKNFLFAIDIRSKRRIGADHILRNKDVIKIVSTASRK